MKKPITIAIPSRERLVASAETTNCLYLFLFIWDKSGVSRGQQTYFKEVCVVTILRRFAEATKC